MSRRHQQDKLGGWPVYATVILLFGGFLAAFLIPELYPLQSHNAWTEFTRFIYLQAMAVLDFLEDGTPALVFVGLVFLVFAVVILGFVLMAIEGVRGFVRRYT